MVENQRNLCDCLFLDSTIFQPSKIKLVLVWTSKFSLLGQLFRVYIWAGHRFFFVNSRFSPDFHFQFRTEIGVLIHHKTWQNPTFINNEHRNRTYVSRAFSSRKNVNDISPKFGFFVTWFHKLWDVGHDLK